MTNKKIVYIDMDNVLVDFESSFARLDAGVLKEFEHKKDEIPGIFSLMGPMPGAIEAFEKLAGRFDTYILSTAPWENPTAWADKLLWVKKHLGTAAKKRLILSHNKHLNLGDYLVDDREKNGADRFSGELLLFGEGNPFPDWRSVTEYLLPGGSVR